MKYLLTLFCLLLAHTFVSAQDATNLRISAADDAYDIQEKVSIKDSRWGRSISDRRSESRED